MTGAVGTAKRNYDLKCYPVKAQKSEGSKCPAGEKLMKCCGQKIYAMNENFLDRLQWK